MKRRLYRVLHGKILEVKYEKNKIRCRTPSTQIMPEPSFWLESFHDCDFCNGRRNIGQRVNTDIMSEN